MPSNILQGFCVVCLLRFLLFTSGMGYVLTYADTLQDCLLSCLNLHHTYPRHICLLITPPDGVPVPVYLHALTVQDGTFFSFSIYNQ